MKEPAIRIIKRLRFIKTTHTAISALGRLQRFFGEFVIWFARFWAKFNLTEKIVLASLITIVIGGGTQIIFANAKETELKPIAGGVHIEGLIGRPKYINPLLAGTNTVDRDLSRLIYSGLTQVGTGREVLPDLASSWDVLENGKVYIFHLQTSAKWHDGEKFSADDVIYTFNVLQNNDYTGVLKSSFSGILVEKLDDSTVRMTLPNPSIFFLTDATVGIMPEHVFKNIAIKDLASSFDTRQIVGTGPYKYQPANVDNTATLVEYKDYYGTKPYVESIVFYFFDNADNLYTAFRNRQISAAGFTDPVFGNLSTNDHAYEYVLPQYKAIFFNQLSENPFVKNQTIRQALAYATNKQQIITDVEKGYAVQVDSPILQGFWGHNPNLKKYEFDIAKAAGLLKKDGWTDSNGDGILDKDKGATKLSLRVAFRDDAKSKKIADLIQQTWHTVGVEAILQPLDASTLIKDAIRPRAYDVLIFGQDLGGNSDPYVYWHSSQIKDPGLNLAPMVDKDIDNNLEQARTATSLNSAITSYLRFQSAFSDLVPAILLYQPKYTYLVDAKVKGVTDKINLSSTTDRFINLKQWYVKAKRE